MTTVKRPFWQRYWPHVFFVIATIFFLLSFVEVPIHITQSKAQVAVNAGLEKKQATDPNFPVKSVELTFNDDSLSAIASGKKTVLGSELSGIVVINRGQVEYRRGDIYLKPDEFEISEFLINGQEPMDAARAAIETTAAKVTAKRDEGLGNGRIKGFLDKVGVSVDKKVNDIAVAATSKGAEEWVKAREAKFQAFIENAVLRTLEDTPVYELGKNSKEKLARAVVDDIQIQNGEVVVTLTGMQFIKTLVAGILIFLFAVGMIIAVMRGGLSGALLGSF